MKRWSVVDLGSNTARMVIYEYEPGVRFRLLNEIREPVRLGQGMGQRRRLGQKAIERAAAALKLYADFAASMDMPPPRVIATSAVRDAENSKRFFDRVEPYGLPIEILPGEKEASLGVTAVANSFTVNDAWVMDLGGGSAQISRMEDRRYVQGNAHPLGAVRLTEAFLYNDPPKESEIKALEAIVEEELSGLAKEMKDGLPLIAMGGSIRNLARAVQKRRNYPLGRIHGYVLKRKDLEKLVDELLVMPVKERQKVPGIAPDRADIILAPALVYRWLLRKSGRDRIWLSRHGVREGAFFEHFLEEPHTHEDVREFSVRNLFLRYPQPQAHTDQVRRLARLLFDGLSQLHGLGSEDADMLDKAAILHDIGMTMSYHNHQKHGAYIIQKTDILDGFTHREQVLLMLLVRYHRRGTPRWGYWRPLAGDGDKKRLMHLATCLRLAEHLERSNAGRIEDIKVWIGHRTVTLELFAKEEPVVEMWETAKDSALFAEAFGRELELEFQPSS